MNQSFYNLMGVREDAQRRQCAAFMHSPCGPYAFEIPVSLGFSALLRRDQELWAQAALHKLGHRFHGMSVGELAQVTQEPN